MKELQFDDGIQEFNVNNRAVVRFCPTDYQFAERLAQVFDKMDALQQKFQGKITAAGSDTWKVCREIDSEMRSVIDNLFDQPGISSEIFGTTSCYGIGNGLPIWCNLILAIMDVVDADIIAQKKATDPRLDAYLAKYKAREAK